MRRWGVLALLALRVAVAGDLSVAFGGLTQDYLEPCGCGGQTAGGLARRAALVAEWRAAAPGAQVLLDLGDYGVRDDRLPLIARCLGYLGVDAGGLSAADLANWTLLQPLLRPTGAQVTSLLPPDLPPAALPLPVPPRSLVLGQAGGPLVGLVSASAGPLAVADLAEVATVELGRLRAAGVRATVLLAHLDEQVAAALLNRLAPADRPTMLALATDDNLPGEPQVRQGVLWLKLARRGRSLVVVTVPAAGPPVARTRIVDEGPLDPRVQAWIDDYYRKLRAGELLNAPSAADVRFARASDCQPCHAAAVAAWRAHPHARAVETLERAGRDVAGCLRCHDEFQRRAGVRPPATGDRGVQCASCHDGLDAHRAAPRARHATLPAADACVACHTRENSPKYDDRRYHQAVRDACRGVARAEAAR